jgi:hypothetical protein
VARITNLRELLADELGVATDSEVTSAQAGVASARLMRQDGNRIAWLLQNLSAANLVIRPDREAALTAGIILAPNEWRSMIYREDFDLVDREWHVIASAAAADYYLLEVRLRGGERGAP